jgi:hypothetical protein
VRRAAEVRIVDFPGGKVSSLGEYRLEYIAGYPATVLFENRSAARYVK